MEYFDDLIDFDENPNPRIEELKRLDSVEAMTSYIEDRTLEAIEENDELMESFPCNGYYAEMRLTYLAENEDVDKNYFLIQLYEDDKVIEHLLDIESRFSEFMKTEKPKMMKAWGIDESDDSEMMNLMSSLREIAIKQIIEE
ncbi:MAG: hypothetical protein SOR72_04310 [Hornefia sp.]|nr:hypothetical protein [Hornefia sp.]